MDDEREVEHTRRLSWLELSKTDFPLMLSDGILEVKRRYRNDDCLGYGSLTDWCSSGSCNSSFEKRGRDDHPSTYTSSLCSIMHVPDNLPMTQFEASSSCSHSARLKPYVQL